MKKIIGYLKNLEGTFFAKDTAGNVREINPGDPIFSGEILVDEEGSKILDSIQTEKVNELDANNKEATVETELSGKDDTEPDNPKTTHHEDIIHSHSSIHNIEASLVDADFFLENDGLVRDEHKHEKDINAPLRKNPFSDDIEKDDAFYHIHGGDRPPFITINDRIVSEDDGTMTFTVTLSKVTGSDVVFDYYSSDLVPIDAREGVDYTGVSGRGVIKGGTLTTTITVKITEDYYKEGNEDFLMNLVPVSGNIDVEQSDLQGVGTITDAGSTTTPPEVISPVDDTIYVQLIKSDSVTEGETLTHGVQLVDASGNPILLKSGESIEVTLRYSANPAINGEDFTGTSKVTIVGTAAGNNVASFSNPTIDDIFAEGVESYTISVAGIRDVNDTFEKVSNKGSVITGTITDNQGTPNIQPDGPEADDEVVIIKLVALDENEDPILDASGNYTFDNIVREGSPGNYMAIAFGPGETTFSPTTKLDVQVGTIDLTFADTTAVGTRVQTAENGTEDYNNTAQPTVTLGTVISTDTFDDYMSDNAEIYTISITDLSYAPTEGGYEDVQIDTSPVNTLIIDDSGTAGNDINGIEDEDNDAVNAETTQDIVQIKLVALDSAGNPIFSNDGITYTFVNEVNEDDAAN
uniref:Calx-beta domain-containing protein n=1 Tax=Sulfurovum sp. TaxID=1969726 RepID=UPI0028680ED2